MRADVANATRSAGGLRVRAPGGLHLAGLLQKLIQPALRILDNDLADLAEIALLDHVLGQLDHGVGGVVVHQAEDLAGGLDGGVQLLGLLDRQGHRLLAHDVEAGFEAGLGDREVRVVRRADRDEIDAVLFRQREFGCDHLLIRAVDAFGVEAEDFALLEAFLGDDIEGARRQHNPAVHAGRFAVHFTDERTDTAADLPHLKNTHITAPCLIGIRLRDF